MVGSDQCPYTDSCETDCVEADLWKFIRLTLSRRRRAILAVLQERTGESITADDLVQAVVEGTAEFEAEQLTTEVEQTYLPMLRERGLLDRDESSSSVRYRGCPFVEDSAELIQPESRVQDEYYSAD